MVFAALIIAATGAASPARAFESASVLATVGHSEWCRPGTVQLDLMTGRYTLTAPRAWRTCRRPSWPGRTRTGRLASRELIPLQVTSDMGQFGLEHPLCRTGGRPERIVVGNGGTPTLRLTLRGRTTAAPGDLACWSGSASRLHCLLDDLFGPPGRPGAGPDAPTFSSPDAVRNCFRRWPLLGMRTHPGG